MKASLGQTKARTHSPTRAPSQSHSPLGVIQRGRGNAKKSVDSRGF